MLTAILQPLRSEPGQAAAHANIFAVIGNAPGGAIGNSKQSQPSNTARPSQHVPAAAADANLNVLGPALPALGAGSLLELSREALVPAGPIDGPLLLRAQRLAASLFSSVELTSLLASALDATCLQAPNRLPAVFARKPGSSSDKAAKARAWASALSGEALRLYADLLPAMDTHAAVAAVPTLVDAFVEPNSGLLGSAAARALKMLTASWTSSTSREAHAMACRGCVRAALVRALLDVTVRASRNLLSDQTNTDNEQRTSSAAASSLACAEAALLRLGGFLAAWGSGGSAQTNEPTLAPDTLANNDINNNSDYTDALLPLPSAPEAVGLSRAQVPPPSRHPHPCHHRSASGANCDRRFGPRARLSSFPTQPRGWGRRRNRIHWGSGVGLGRSFRR